MRIAEDTKIEDIMVGAHRRANICLAIPTFGMVPIEFMLGFGRLRFPVNGVCETVTVKGMEVGQARNYIITELLKRPKNRRPEYVFMYGDDMIAPWDGLMKLYEEMKAGDWDALTGLYYWKSEPPMPLTWRNDHVGRLLPGVHYTVGETIWVDVSGLDFTLLRMEFFEKLTPPYFQTGPSATTNGGVVIYTEDVYFAAKLKQAGGRWGVHTGVRVAHYDVKSGMIY
jgi:hypothetical protein